MEPAFEHDVTPEWDDEPEPEEPGNALARLYEIEALCERTDLSAAELQTAVLYAARKGIRQAIEARGYGNCVHEDGGPYCVDGGPPTDTFALMAQALRQVAAWLDQSGARHALPEVKSAQFALGWAEGRFGPEVREALEAARRDEAEHVAEHGWTRLNTPS